jgi:hypothetical protein
MHSHFRHSLILTGFVLISFSANSQRIVSQQFKQYASIVSYGVDFEIKGVDTAGLETLVKIDIARYLPLRKPNERVEITDTISGVTIVLYSEKEMQVIRYPYYRFEPYSNGRKNE